MERPLDLKYLGSRMNVIRCMIAMSALVLGVVQLAPGVVQLVPGVARLVLRVVRLVNENTPQPAPGSRDCTSRTAVDSFQPASVDLGDIFFLRDPSHEYR